MYIALTIDERTRSELKRVFPPKYDDFIGHHVTLNSGVRKNTLLPDHQYVVEVVGYADDGKGIEALVVSVDGKTQRPDGNTFHITWSLDRSKGYKPVSSNDLLERDYTSITPYIEVTTNLEMLK